MTAKRLAFAFSLFSGLSAIAQTFTGANGPGTFQDFPLTIGPGATNLAIVIPGNTNTFSHLLLKKGVAPTEDQKKKHITQLQVNYDKYLSDLLQKHKFQGNSVVITPRQVEQRGGPGVRSKRQPIYERLAFGVVKGYEVDGKSIPPYTTIGGAFEHAKAHGDAPPYELPKSWFKARESGGLRLDTPFNFVSTADIIGGNSGSPVVNRDNQVVGLIFDGNIQSLVLDFGYDDRQARAVSVDSRGILEALRSVYHADRLVAELTGR